MPEDEIEDQEPESSAPKRKSRLSVRNLLIVSLVAVVLLAALLLTSVITYRYGVFDSWIKAQFTAKMADIGIVFSADEFALTVAPLELHLVNATFNDRVSGESFSSFATHALAFPSITFMPGSSVAISASTPPISMAPRSG